MKINNSTIQGLYNFNTAPRGVIFTKDDLVLYGSILYTCLSETSSEPNVNEDEWEYYLNNLSPVKTLTELEDPVNSNKLVTSNSVREFLQKSIPGTNSDGTLKILAGGTLEEVLVNSKFQADSSWLLDLYTQDDTYLPFVPSLEKIYILSTLGNFTGSNFDNETLIHQELVEIDSIGTTVRYTRTGQSLSSLVWSTVNINLTVQKYLDYLDRVLSKHTIEKALYTQFLSDVSSGEYNYWKAVPQDEIDLISNEIAFSTDSGITDKYRVSKFYRIYLAISEGGNIYKHHIDITPEDHSFLALNQRFYFREVENLTLTKVQTTRSLLAIPSGVTVLGILESNTFSI
jgi:hypothetical protein